MQNVTLLGLGVMGAGMAASLLRAGYTVTVWNRTADRAGPLVAGGAREADTPRGAAIGADVVLAMLGDDTASRSVWLGRDGALEGMGTDAVLIESSTLSRGWVLELQQHAEARGIAMLDAPVLGSVDAAASGQLKLLVGGASRDLEVARGVLEAVGNGIHHMGAVGAGTSMKLINNIMALSQVAGLAEGLAVAERAGLRLEQAVEVLRNGAPGSPMVRGRIERVAARTYDNINFELRWALKDIEYALRQAEETGTAQLVGEAARVAFARALEMGLGDRDASAVAETFWRSEA